MEKVLLDRHELEDWASRQPGFVGIELGRVSAMLLAQLRDAQESRSFSTFSVTDELQYLEGVGRPTRTKSEDQFRRPPLIGLYKKHFSDPRFVLGNLDSHFGYSRGGNRRLTQTVAALVAEESSEIVDEKFAAKVAHRVTVKAWEERANAESLTGEWIVYEKRAGRNVYLTLGSHTEGDARIWERVCIARDFLGVWT